VFGRLRVRRGGQKEVEQPREPEQAPVTANFSVAMAGATLVVGPAEGAGQAALALARTMPADRGRTVVVVDVPPGAENTFWGSVAAALQGRGPIRLAASHAGSMRPTAPAQWLATQLQTEVIAPDGAVSVVPGAVFVAGTQGYGCWLRFQPGASPTPFGRRFPVPLWETMDPNSAWPTGDVGIAEPIPAGLWLRAQAVPLDPNSMDARPVLSLPCRENVLTIVVGGPGQPVIPTEEVCRLLTALPSGARTRVRLVQYAGSGELGQLVAEQLGEPIAAYTGLPVANLREGSGAGVVAVNRRGHPTWRPFVTEVRCVPRNAEDQAKPAVPVVVGYRPPVPGLVEVEPAVFSLGDGVVLEAVASGLWVREADLADGADVRSQPVDPEWARLTVGTPGRATPGAVAVAGAALVERLEPEVRKLLRVVFCDATATAVPWPAAPVEEEPPAPVEPPVVPAVPVVPVPAGAHAAPEVSAPAPLFQPSEVPLRLDGPLPAAPVPSWEASAPAWSEQVVDEDRETVPADHQSTDEEWDAVRRILGERYAPHAAAIGRMLAQRSGGPVDPISVEAIVTELAAVSACLTQDEEMVVETLRSGRLGRLRPYIGAVVSGMRRLPLHQGVTTCWGGTEEAPRYRSGDVLVDHGLLNTLANPQGPSDGGVEYLLWSVTGRRIGVVDRKASIVQERVLFAPGTPFKVLAIAEAENSSPMQVMLQEVVDPQRERQLASLRPGTLTQLERAARALRTLTRV